LDVEVKGDRELVRERQFTSEDVPWKCRLNSSEAGSLKNMGWDVAISSWYVHTKNVSACVRTI
jgi:hypothetical protein